MQTNLSVRLFRVRTGWRREEWAHRPLFICGKFHPESTGNQRDTGRIGRRLAAGSMVVSLEEIRKAAERVAASHGLDVVDVELAGSAKERTLRVSLEKNAEGRAELKARLAAAGTRTARRIYRKGFWKARLQWSSFPGNARRLRGVQPRFWSFAGRRGSGSRRRVHAGGQFAGPG